MFKTGDLVLTNKYFNNKFDLLCLILNPQFETKYFVQVYCMKFNTIYYLHKNWCDLL